MRPDVREYVESLVVYASGAAMHAYGAHPIEMTPMAYVSGALNALERVGLLTSGEAHEAMMRAHDAYGLRRPPEPPPGGGLYAYEPEWADERPPPWPLSPPR